MKSFLKDYILPAYRHKRILRVIDLPKGGIILDVSCSDGKFIGRLHHVSSEATYFGVDISGEDIERAKANFSFATFAVGSAEGLPFEDSTFDIVFSILSLHHYENPRDFFKEVFRVLKPEGCLYLVDLIPKYQWSQKIYNWNGCPEPYHFEKFYSIKDLELLLKSAGLKIMQDLQVTVIPRIRVLRIQKI